MTRPAVLAAVVLAEATVLAWSPPPHSNEAAWTNAPLGIAVTDCVYSTRGIGVRFLTDLPGPYNVSVYLPREMSLRRNRPVREVVTDANEAFLPGNFQEVAVFVQVMPQHVVESNTNRVALTDVEWRAHVAEIRDAPPFLSADSDRSREFWPVSRATASALSLLSDYTWVGFVATDEPNPSFNFTVGRLIGTIVTNWVQDIAYTNWTAYYRQGETEPYRASTNAGVYATERLDRGDWHFISTNGCADGAIMVSCTDEHAQHNAYPQFTNDASRGPVHSEPYEFNLSIEGADTSVGTGYRIVYLEDTGAVLAQRAYSARTNASDEVCIPRGFRSLSAHGGYRYTADWEGRLYFQADTNSTPDVIGGGR